MVVRNPRPRKPDQSAVELAIAALDGSPNPLDMDMMGIDPDPTSLDLTLAGRATGTPPSRGRLLAGPKSGSQERSLRRENAPSPPPRICAEGDYDPVRCGTHGFGCGMCYETAQGFLDQAGALIW